MMGFEHQIRKYAEQPLTSQMLLGELKDYARPYDKINDLVKKGSLIQLRRGLYIPGDDLHLARPTPFLIANHLYGPSYVSIDSALSYWGLIPEKVFEIISCTIRPNRRMKTTVGRFTYLQMPLPYYSFGIERMSLTDRQTILMASPEKALCDKIISTPGILFRSHKQVLDYLIEDLRIDEYGLKELDLAEITRWLPSCKKRNSIALMLKSLLKL